MGLRDDLQKEVNTIFKSAWEVTTGRVVPVPSSVGLGNKAILLEKAVVLYADLDGSTSMVDSKKWQFSAEIYKTFLHCSAKVMKAESADITAYDGDRIMAIFIGDEKCDRAARAGLKLNWAVKNIIVPEMHKQYTTDFKLAHTVGIDMTDLRAARTGVRGDNDLVWVGRAANYAAKLNELSSEYPTRVTSAVYADMTNATRTSRDGRAMWERVTWNDMNAMTIYRSGWSWEL